MKQRNDEGHGHTDLTSGLRKNGIVVLCVAERCCMTALAEVVSEGSIV